jgi:hypothetical protein
VIVDVEELRVFPDDRNEINEIRIRPTDELIKLARVQTLMGGMSVSAVYEDPDLMALKLSVMAAGESTRAVRWIEREVLDLRARRVARSEERAASVRARIEERRERRRAKQRGRTAAKPSTRVPA